MNRRLEFLFHDAELLLAARACLEGNTGCVQDSSDVINSLWPKMLLNQFHDVLPGTSIEMVSVVVIMFLCNAVYYVSDPNEHLYMHPAYSPTHT